MKKLNLYILIVIFNLTSLMVLALPANMSWVCKFNSLYLVNRADVGMFTSLETTTPPQGKHALLVQQFIGNTSYCAQAQDKLNSQVSDLKDDSDFLVASQSAQFSGFFIVHKSTTIEDLLNGSAIKLRNKKIIAKDDYESLIGSINSLSLFQTFATGNSSVTDKHQKFTQERNQKLREIFEVPENFHLN